MRLLPVGIFWVLLLTSSGLCADKKEPDKTDIPPEDVAVIRQMEVLELMDTVEQMDLLKEMDILIEDEQHDNED